MQTKWMSWSGRLRSLAFGRRKVWWAVTAGVVVLLVASIVVTIPGRIGRSGPPTTMHNIASVTSSYAGAATASTAVAGGAEYGLAQSAAQGAPSATAPDMKAAAIGSVSQQRLVIETANVDLTVSQLSKVTGDISTLTSKYGGFIQSMNQSTDSQGQASATFTIRVPENEFQPVVKRIRSLGKVNTFAQNGQDVTNEHNNLQLQISELQSEAQAYTRLFDKATKMSDMLQIQQSLTQVNNEISNLNNQLHQLNHTIAYATISVTLSPSVVPIHQGNEPFWAPLVQSLHFMQRVGVGLSKVVGWLLPWGILGGLLYGGVHVWRRRNARKA